MANTYESKFKGVEVDDGVNTATYATGTGGINVTIKGTTNVTGTSGRHLEIDGSGKQDKITGGTSLNAAALSVDSLTVSSSINAGGAVNIAADTMTFEIGPNDIIFKSDWGGSVVFNNSAIFKGTPGVRFYLGDTGEYANILAPSNGTGVYDVRLPDTGGTLALTSDIPTGSGGSAGVSSIGGKTGAITLGGGLQISGQEITSNLYCHNVVGQYESSDGLAFAILLTFYNYNSDAYSEIFDTFQDLFEGGVFVLANGGTSVSVPILIGIPKTSGASTGWNPGLFERIETGVITGGALYGNFTGTYTSMTLSEISTIADDVIGPLSA